MKQIFRLLLLCLCLSAVTPSLYSQELTEKEKKEQAKAQARQEKENAKQERKQKKDAKKKEREAKVRARYDAFIQEFEPDSLTTLQVDSFFIAATELKRGGVTVDGMLDVFGKFFGAAGTAAGGATGIKERFYRRADNIFAIMSVIVKRNQLIEMVPQPFFDEEMGVSDTTWVAINRNTGQEFARGDATLLYGVSLAAASGIALLAAQVVKEVPSVVSELKSLGFAAALEIPQLLKTGANLTMTGQVLPLVISQIKDNQEKLAYKRANEAQEAEELPTDSIPEGSAPSDGISSAQ